jgi:mannose-1-phosphate guanylyltransferase
MTEHHYAIIMAGGGGTRLWPLSRQARPKQMLSLTGDRTLFQMAIDRLEGVFAMDHILVVTVAEQAEILRQQVPAIPSENYLIEPMPRGTASVVGWSAAVLQQRDPDAVMAVLTADHIIGNVGYFRSLLQEASSVASAGYLVTLGIKPTFPSTGYGYIQRGKKLPEFPGTNAFEVLRFKEKPDEITARKLIEQGDHDWNSGMFIWRVDRILQEIEHSMPELHLSLKRIIADWHKPDRMKTVQQVWPGIKPETIDYGIMEKAIRVAVIPAANLHWNDVGSWDSLFETITPDEDGNIFVGADCLTINTRSSLLCSDNKKRLIAAIGVENLIIVETGDAILVCSRDQAQKVRDLVNLLKQNQRHNLL